MDPEIKIEYFQLIANWKKLELNMAIFLKDIPNAS